MDENVYQTDEPFRLETEDIDNENTTATTTSFPPNASNGLHTAWSPAIRVSALSVLMLLTLLGNVIVIITIVSCAELRKKRVNVFILNLAVGDMMVCFVSMPTYVLMAFFGQWMLGAATCKLSAYGFIVAVAFANLLLTAMSIDRYQVRHNSSWTWVGSGPIDWVRLDQLLQCLTLTKFRFKCFSQFGSVRPGFIVLLYIIFILYYIYYIAWRWWDVASSHFCCPARILVKFA